MVLQAGCVLNLVCLLGDLLIFVESEQFIRDMCFHCLESERVGEMQGSDSCPKNTMQKLIKALTHQTILMKLRGSAKHPLFQ